MGRLFLHFINRELHLSLNRPPDIDEYLRVMRICTVLFDGELACNISQIYELLHDRPLHLKETLFLNKALIVELDSSHPTFFDFHKSRQAYYAHDLARYPMYATDAPSHIFSDARIGEVHQTQSTTIRIELEMHSALQEGGRIPRGLRETEKQTLRRKSESIRKVLVARDGAALTFPLFPARGIALSSEAEGVALRRILTAAYINHYMDEWSANIVTSIPGITYYDRCANDPALEYVYPFMGECIVSCGIDRFLENKPNWGLIDRVEARSSLEHSIFVQRYRQLAAGLDVAYSFSDKSANRAAWAVGQLRKLNFTVPCDLNVVSLRTLFLRCAEAICSVANILTSNLAGFSEGWKAMDEVHGVRVLIMTATDLEDRVFNETLIEQGLRVVGRDRGDVSRGDIESITEVFGIPGVEIRKVRSSAGSIGSSASTLVASDAISRSRAKFVVSSGICFGMNETKSKMGNVLVSEHVTIYEPGRVGEKIDEPLFKPRGPRIPAGPTLLDRAREAKLHWTRADVQVGLILSGEKLVDSESFREFLRTFVEPEGLGGEMEAAGIVSTAHRRGIEWVVIKGICDWGVGKGDHDQELAARNAISFTFEMFKRLA